MRRKQKYLIMGVLLFMAIGFAAITTTLVLTGTLTIGANPEDFDIYFSEVVLDNEDISSSAISSNGKSVTFNANELTTIGDVTKLEYEVTNASRQFDANVSVECNSENVSSGDASLKNISDYLNIEYPDNGSTIKARETGTGTIKLTLKKAAIDEINVGISCNLVIDATERDELAQGDPNSGGILGGGDSEGTRNGVSGYVINADNQILPKVNLVIYSDTPNYVTTDDEGYFEINTLEIGSHEAYLMLDYTIDQLKSMTKSEHISKASSKANFTTSSKTVSFDNGYKIVDRIVSDASYIISFNANGGSVEIASKTIKYGEVYGEMPIPTLLGYTFRGWFTSTEFNNQITESKKAYITGNQTLYAKWEANSYQVSFDSAGGSVLEPITIKYNQLYGVLPIPTRTGFNFMGWYLDGNLINDTTRLNKTSDHTLLAKWEEKKITVEIDNEGLPSDIELNPDLPVKDQLPEPEKEGFNFDGWYLDEDCTIPVTEDTMIPEDGNIKFYPKYEAKKYTVTFNANTGTVTQASKSVTYNQTYGELPIPTKNGYNFIGWFTALTDGEQVIAETVVDITANQTLYARWRAKDDIVYTIKHWQQNIGGNANNKDTSNYTLVRTETLSGVTDQSVTPNTISYEGFTAPTKETIKVKADGTSEVNYYYTRNSYTLNVTKDIGVATVNSKSSYQYDENVSITYTVKDGYTFKSITGDKNTATFKMPASNVNVTINTTENTYTISYTLNGGNVNNPTSYKVTSNDITLASPTKTGYTFTGWTGSNGGSPDKNVKISKGSTGNKNYTANFIPNTYTVTFNANGGNPVATILTVSYDATYGDTLPTPTREGYNFVGWFMDGGNGAQVMSTTTVKLLSDVELTALWVESDGITYRVKHHLQNIGGNADVKDANNYTIIKTEVLSGTTNETVNPNTLDYEGFTAPAKESLVVKADGTAEINYYYKRNSYNLTINKGTGVASVSGAGTYQYDQVVNINYVMLDGYTFDSISGDKTESTFNMPAQGITVTVNASANKYNVTFDAAGGNTSFESKQVTFNQAYGELPVATRTGYKFLGWYIGSNKIEETSVVKIISDETIVAKWEANKYTLTFNPNGGNVSEATREIAYNANYGSLPTPTLSGYNFIGWFTDTEYTNQVTNEMKYNVLGDQTLYAKWESISLTVTFNTDGGNELEPKTVKYNQMYGELPTPEKYGHNFVGWSLDGEGVSSSTRVTKLTNHTLKALWEAKKVTVIIEINGVPTEVEADMSIPVKDALGEPEKDGYDFEGWYLDEDCTIPVTDETKIPEDGNIKFYPKYNVKKYTVDFNPNTGSVSITSKEVTYDAPYGELPTPTKNGYNFIGWFTHQTDGDQITDTTIVKITANQTLYAHWVARDDIVYTVKHWKQNIGGNAEIKDDTNYTLAKTEVLQGSTDATVNPNTIVYEGFTAPNKESIVVKVDGSAEVNYYYTRNNYTLTVSGDAGITNLNHKNSYAYGEDVNVTYTVKTGYTLVGITGDKTTSTFTMPASNVALTISTTEDVYTITYTLDGGEASNPTSYKVTTNDITLVNPTKMGYTFTGWTGSNGETPEINVTIPKGSTGNKTYTANFTPNTYTVSFDSNGGNEVATVFTVTYDATYGETFPVPERLGYEFVGWHTSKTEDSEVTSTSKVAITENTTLYAHWKVINYNITYELNGGTNNASNPSKYTVEDSITLKAPTKSEYDFTGWSETIDGEKTIEYKIEKGSTGDITLIANWIDTYKFLTPGNLVESVNNLGKTYPARMASDGTADNNMRYIGENPNNYVEFNGELWRIIGVMNNVEDESGSRASRIKLIRADSIGDYIFDNKPAGTGSSHTVYGSNNWADSRLMEMLNSGPYWNRTSGICYVGENGGTTDCDFSSNGLTNEAKAMISTVVWNLGSQSTSDSSLASNFYASERGTVVYYDSYPTVWTGKVGLMYPSDYGYAVGGKSRDECLALGLFKYSKCFKNDWLYLPSTDKYQLTMTQTVADPTHLYAPVWNGDLSFASTHKTNIVQPVVYLDTNINVTSGKGTTEEPYKISLPKLETGNLVDSIKKAADTSSIILDDETNDHNLRYVGSTPNNYVEFNGEKWRIIGVMNNVEDDTGAKASRVKLIRADSIGEYSYDNKPTGTGSSTADHGSSDWTDSRLMEALNSGPYWNRTLGECPQEERDYDLTSPVANRTTSCDFTSGGLTSDAKSMITRIKWNLGGASFQNTTASIAYDKERGTDIFNGRPTTWKGFVGLMYPSDFGYEVGKNVRDVCLNKNMFNYKEDDCDKNIWMHPNSVMWLLSPIADHGHGQSALGDGYLSSDRVRGVNEVRPVVYLNTNIQVKSGSGTSSDPYKLENPKVNVAAPKIDNTNNLKPVTIADDGKVTYVSQSDSNWYDYAARKWANAVILKDSPSKTYNVGDVIKEDDIQSYFVWIPKYKYKLWNVDVDNPSLLAHTIDIVFDTTNTTDVEGKSCKTPMTSGGTDNCNNGEYMTHPAFISLGVNGFWVGKFETGYNGATTTATAQVNSSDASKIIVKPNVFSWRNNTVYNMFVSSYNYKRNLDSHMMKNTEWGAVAFLSHSKYGINNEVNINNNSSYKTGYSALQATNQAYNTAVGYLASTTGNISGVYDMSGGAWEYVSAYISGKLGSSGFNTTTLANYNTKYFDVYNVNSTVNNYQYRILGDATGEMGPFNNYADSDGTVRWHNSWYGDVSGFVDSDRWFHRGGGFVDGVLGGAFDFSRHTGGAYTGHSFRLILVG